MLSFLHQMFSAVFSKRKAKLNLLPSPFRYFARLHWPPPVPFLEAMEPDGGYTKIVVKISKDVPEKQCPTLLRNLKVRTYKCYPFYTRYSQLCFWEERPSGIFCHRLFVTLRVCTGLRWVHSAEPYPHGTGRRVHKNCGQNQQGRPRETVPNAFTEPQAKDLQMLSFLNPMLHPSCVFGKKGQIES